MTILGIHYSFDGARAIYIGGKRWRLGFWYRIWPRFTLTDNRSYGRYRNVRIWRLALTWRTA